MRRTWAVLAVAAMLGACASGSAVVTGQQRAQVALEAVKVYGQPPAKYEVIGLVEASSDAGMTGSGSMEYAMRELREQAGKIGANGVLVRAIGGKSDAAWTGSMLITSETKSVNGEAIYVTKE